MPPRSTNKRGGIVFYGTLIATEPEPETPMATTVRPTAAAHPSTSTEVQRVLELIKEKKIQVVDVKFCDLPGTWQHFSIPAASLDEAMIREGLGFDGSSIRSFQAINESDMLLLPDASTAFVDPFRRHKTLNVNFFIHDPITREAYSRDPRNVAKKAEAYLASSGIADAAYFGPEAEFYVFDSV